MPSQALPISSRQSHYPRRVIPSAVASQWPTVLSVRPASTTSAISSARRSPRASRFEILRDEHDHRQEYLGDEGIRWEPIEDVTEEEVFGELLPTQSPRRQ